MSNNKSKVTDPPPYFRQTERGVAALVTSKYDFLKELKDVAEATVGASATIRYPASPYARELMDLFLPEVWSSAGWHAEARMQIKRLTEAWRGLGVGPIRMLYYIQCVETLPRRKGREVPNPTSSHYYRRKRALELTELFFAQNQAANGFNARLWIARDRLLEALLKAFGLRWIDIELEICAALGANLPTDFCRRSAGEPDAARLCMWKDGLERWGRYRKAGQPFDVAAAHFLDSLGESPADKKLAHEVTRLRQSISPPEWTVRAGDKLSTYCTTKTSPIINAVLLAVHDSLWEKIPQPANVPQAGPDFMPRIASEKWKIKQNGEEKKQRATELWMLIADIVQHLSICLGLPEPVSPLSGDAANSAVFTADIVAQRLRPLVKSERSPER